MFVTRSAWQRGTSSIEGGLFLVPGGRVLTMKTLGLTMDSRFMAPVAAPLPCTHLLLVLDGWIALEGRGDRIPAPTAVCLEPGEYEARQAGAAGLRIGGAPRASIEVTLPPAAILVPRGLARGAFPLPPAVTSAARALIDAHAAPTPERLAACQGLLDVLSQQGLVQQGLARVEHDRGSAQSGSSQRLLDALEVLYRTHETRAYSQLIANLAGLSVRQLSRDMQALRRSALLPGTTLRELFRVLRLRRAALLLSAADLSPSDVAREVGYGSLDAMGRAMRDAHLPAPSVIRAALLEDG
jgi:AraC-like DNA-binding protein